VSVEPSITETVFEKELATYTLLVTELTSMEIGLLPTVMVAVIVSVEPSITVTVFEPWLVTYTLLVFGLTAIPNGLLPTSTVPGLMEPACALFAKPVASTITEINRITVHTYVQFTIPHNPVGY